MHLKFPQLITFCICVCLSLLTLEARQVEVRFIGVEASSSSLYLKKGTAFEQVDLPLYQNSAYYEAETADGNKLRLYAKIETAEGPRFEMVVEGTIPSGAESALGVYIIASNGHAQLYFYDDDWSHFPKQSYRIINISPVVINSKVDESLLQLQPFESEIAKVNLGKGLPLVRIITVYKDGNNEWQPIYNQRTALRPSWRITGIVVVTQGKLAESMGLPSVGDNPENAKASLSYFSFKDTSPTRVLATPLAIPPSAATN